MNSEKKIKSFRDLIVWQKSMELAQDVYLLSGDFPATEIYGLTSQIRRAAISIPTNIAEGKGRIHRKEFAHFLGIARGSVTELQSLLELSTRLRITTQSSADKLMAKSKEVERMLSSFVKALTFDL
jgi:four helix bundle protein